MDAGVVGEPAADRDGGCLNPIDPQSKRLFTPDSPFHSLDAMNGGGGRLDGVCIDAIALDGDKLKPREDQRKGGNGFGINEEGAGYTLTGVDRHGVAYENDHLNGCEVARSINGNHDDSVTDSGTSVVHVGMAQNTRDEVRIVGDGEIVGALPAEPGMKQQTYVVSTNSNGEDVAPTILSCEYKMGQRQKDTGGGYVISKRV